MHVPLPARDVVLLGAGHTNAHVIRMWRMRPVRGARLTCVSNAPVATYSGMLPGVLAGLYAPEGMEIDLVRLCAAAGARLIVGDVCGLDVEGRRLLFADRAPLGFDVLSIGIGSVPTFEGVDVRDASRVVPIKPMQDFLGRLEAHLRARAGARAPVRVLVVGGGAGGVEVALCLRARAARGAAPPCEIALVTADARLLPGSLDGTARRAARACARAGVRVETGRRVAAIDGARVAFADGGRAEVDVVIWATGAAPPPLAARLGLPVDHRGFLRTDRTLRTVGGAPIFVVGDTGAIDGAATPKAGVYAVRQGPVLWANIRRQLSGRPLRTYAPQRGFLKLLNTGRGRAIGEWKIWSFEGRWAWRLKDAIDRRFVRMYQDVAPMPAVAETAAPTAAAEMRCLGCGGKIGAGVLARALRRLDIPRGEHVQLGLEAADDAAVVAAPGGRPVAVTVDFFAAPLDDPYLVGRLAALNAASDAFAIGAEPFAALAMVTLPVGPERQQEELLYQVLAGGLRELRTMGATLVGGHTIEGPQLTVGFTLLASQAADPPRGKGGLRPGDRLVLTKALGTGVLLAAHQRARCRARWFEALLASMLTSNAAAAACLEGLDVSGLTDVTGFGLARHLLEMLEASGASARLVLARVPLLPGTAELIEAGVESTLAPANRASAAAIAPAGPPADARLRALFDPQTGGGLLAGVAARDAEALVARLRARGYADATVIGEVVTGEPAIRIE